jgi:hypothetical protein|tara:strand:+ start:184 stop:297 length:114 start_codon:yes stop_codon:yes gene_type:complete
MLQELVEALVVLVLMPVLVAQEVTLVQVHLVGLVIVQ